MADHFAEGLAAYRARNWRSAVPGFDSALEVVPEEGRARLSFIVPPSLIARLLFHFLVDENHSRVAVGAAAAFG